MKSENLKSVSTTEECVCDAFSSSSSVIIYLI